LNFSHIGKTFKSSSIDPEKRKAGIGAPASNELKRDNRIDPHPQDAKRNEAAPISPVGAAAPVFPRQPQLPYRKICAEQVNDHERRQKQLQERRSASPHVVMMHLHLGSRPHQHRGRQPVNEMQKDDARKG
jgi:hypothetical protein